VAGVVVVVVVGEVGSGAVCYPGPVAAEAAEPARKKRARKWM
jgi:hypothetical protein